MPKLGTNRKKIKDSSRAEDPAEAKQKHKRKQRAAAAAAAAAGDGTSRQQLAAARLFEAAQQAIAQEQYEAALEALRDACELAPDNVELLDAHGALLAELGMEEEAVRVLRRAAQLSPDVGFEKFMYLGQLLEGRLGLQATQRGVEVLQQAVNRVQEEQQAAGGSSAGSGRMVQQLNKQLAAALCSLAEMIVSAAEDVPAVAGDAEALLQRARAADGASPEPLQALASLRYELGQPEEALGLLRQSMARWCTPERGSDSASDGDGWEEASDADAAHAMQQDDAAVAGAAAGADADGGFVIPKKPVTMSEAGDEAEPEPMPADGGGPDCAAELDDGDDDESDALPSYEFRFECAKLLLELDEDTDTAVGVLEDLLAENDAVLDVWHLLGLAYYSGGSLQEAAEVCAAGLARMQQQGVPPDEGIALAFDDLQSAIAEAQQQDGERDAAD